MSHWKPCNQVSSLHNDYMDRVLMHALGGKLVIVNLQKTPKDKKAFLVIRHEVDKVGPS